MMAISSNTPHKPFTHASYVILNNKLELPSCCSVHVYMSLAINAVFTSGGCLYNSFNGRS